MVQRRTTGVMATLVAGLAWGVTSWGLASGLAGMWVVPAMAQNDALTPPPDLGTGPLPVPMDGTAIYGGPPPSGGEIAIPVPPDNCPGLQAMMQRQGVVLIPTGGGNAQRYVRDQAYCYSGQEANPAWVPTADNPQCFIGYTCAEPNDDGDN